MVAALLTFGLHGRQAAVPPIDQALAWYSAWSSKLARAQRAEVNVYPPANGEFHDLRYWLQRPSSGGVHGMHYGFDTDGRRSRSDCDAFGSFNRKAKPGDLQSYLKLPGFESFYAPKAKVTGRGPLRIVRSSKGRLVGADLVIDNQKVTLYFDPITRNLQAYSNLPVAEDPTGSSMDGYYLSVTLSPTRKPIEPVAPDTLKSPPR